jgi:hypothetical protein
VLEAAKAGEQTKNEPTPPRQRPPSAIRAAVARHARCASVARPISWCRSLYVALRRRYSLTSHNNGWIYLSQRDAEDEIGSHRDYVGRWFRELQHYGFIVMTSEGSLGVDGKGKAPHWRLTELGCRRDQPTRDFLRWKGDVFAQGKTETPDGNG